LASKQKRKIFAKIFEKSQQKEIIKNPSTTKLMEKNNRTKHIQELKRINLKRFKVLKCKKLLRDGTRFIFKIGKNCQRYEAYDDNESP